MERWAELRREIRFPVSFRTTFSSRSKLAGEGTIHNLSASGCLIKSDLQLKEGTEIVLRLYQSEVAARIEIERATVRWARQGEFGVQFIDAQPEEVAQLRDIIKQLKEQESKDH